MGDRVRIALGGRRVGGWITALDVEPPPGVVLRPLAKWSGRGPTPDLLELAEWAAWRWAGRPAQLLRTASPERNVMALPPAPRRAARPGPGVGARPGVGPRVPRDPVGGGSGVGRANAGGAGGPGDVGGPGPAGPGGVGRAGGPGLPERLAAEALAAGRGVVRLPPAADVFPVVAAAAARGNALVLCPTLPQARALGRRLRAAGVPVALHPRDWALGAAGATVVGTRAAAWAPVGDLAAVVVVDEHDESHQQEQAPTWHARDVAAERARRAGVPCVLTSPCPTLEAQRWGRVVAPGRPDEREGWPVVDVVDMRDQDPRTGLLPAALVRLLRSDRRVLCVLNRTGRARLLACTACGELARCERCDAAVGQPGDELACARCGETRPVICAACGATKLRTVRSGVTRVRDEIAALVGEPVDEVTGARPSGDPPASRVVVGTEATLHQVARADAVAFLDLDQELLAPRYRAAEQALALLARAARLVGPRSGPGRLVLQTHLPRHEVVQAALHGDPTRVAAAEAGRRELLRFPPVTAMAEVSGAAAEAFVAELGRPLGVEVMGPSDGRWLLRAPDHATLCDALAATRRPPGRLRIAVDPLRI